MKNKFLGAGGRNSILVREALIIFNGLWYTVFGKAETNQTSALSLSLNQLFCDSHDSSCLVALPGVQYGDIPGASLMEWFCSRFS